MREPSKTGVRGFSKINDKYVLVGTYVHTSPRPGPKEPCSALQAILMDDGSSVRTAVQDQPAVCQRRIFTRQGGMTPRPSRFNEQQIDRLPT